MYAAHLLTSLPHPSGRRLLYELGAHALMVFEISKAKNAMYAMLDPAEISSLHGLLPTLGSQSSGNLVPRLRVELQQDEGTIAAVFPPAHPSWAQRLPDVLDAIAAHPDSTDYQRQSYGEERAEVKGFVSLICDVLESSQQ